MLKELRELIWEVAGHRIYAVAVTVGVGIAAAVLVLYSWVLFVPAMAAAVGAPLCLGMVIMRWHQRGWIFEVLSLEETWEIGERGARVSVTKRMDIQYLRNDTVAITDPAWGDGDLFAEYSCSPGKSAGVFQDGPRRYAHVILSPPRRRGDLERVESTRVIAGGFLNPSEWIEVDSGTCRGPVSITVVFPNDRPPSNCTWTCRKGGKDRTRGDMSIKHRPDGRQECCLRIARASTDEIYRLVWTW